MDIFPFEYVGGGYFRRKGAKPGVPAEILHGQQAIDYVINALTAATPSGPTMTLDDLFPRFAAHAEVNSDPDYEVGDYQELCRAMRDTLTAQQWQQVLASERVVALLDVLPESE